MGSLSRRFDQSKTTHIRGKDVVFSSKKLKSGGTAYYRDGRRVTTPYQKRLAKGILQGKNPTQARGHKSFEARWGDKRLTSVEIAQQDEFHLGNWAESPRADKRGRQRVRYYAKVLVTNQSFRQVGSDPSKTEGEACTPATLSLIDPDVNTQSGFTYGDLKSRFSHILMATVERYGLELCTGNLQQDTIAFWRAS